MLYARHCWAPAEWRPSNYHDDDDDDDDDDPIADIFLTGRRSAVIWEIRGPVSNIKAQQQNRSLSTFARQPEIMHEYPL